MQKASGWPGQRWQIKHNRRDLCAASLTAAGYTLTWLLLAQKREIEREREIDRDREIEI